MNYELFVVPLRRHYELVAYFKPIKSSNLNYGNKNQIAASRS